ncbi:MbtH-like domain-containing protein [Frankia sp. AiPs1]|uniref:YqcI/YcgG family protein n=1 Tax=Frankia sp. AiPa1 TaxID=573492 RepID=UPI00202AE0F4|nr:YqcI/YcgG family protein [Frankia sp. AiPa1]MCL9761936.1 YqcI/YcgG family protein [Frankia sp. AiPa1]
MTDSHREAVQDLTLGPLPAWGTGCVQTMMDTLTSTEEPFPCVFAVAAANRGGLRFGFVDDLDDRRTWPVLPDILATYLSVYQEISRNTSLVVFFSSGQQADVIAYEQRFWSLLQYLHDGDGEPWPSDIPTETDDPGWEFSFRGTPIFVVCNTPAHQRLRSRSSPVFTITFQPRWVFEGLEPYTPRGAAARRTIRERLRRMDEVDSTPLLGSFGDPANREWKQYFLRDDATVADGCPFLADRARSRAVAGVPAGSELFKVVVNAEEQYSVWPAGRRNALGWFDTSVVGTREQCLDSIASTWSDLRPRSLRRRMGRTRPPVASGADVERAAVSL